MTRRYFHQTTEEGLVGIVKLNEEERDDEEKWESTEVNDEVGSHEVDEVAEVDKQDSFFPSCYTS